LEKQIKEFSKPDTEKKVQGLRIYTSQFQDVRGPHGDQERPIVFSNRQRYQVFLLERIKTNVVKSMNMKVIIPRGESLKVANP